MDKLILKSLFFNETARHINVPLCATILHTSGKTGENKGISQTSQLLQIEKMKKMHKYEKSCCNLTYL